MEHNALQTFQDGNYYGATTLKTYQIAQIVEYIVDVQNICIDIIKSMKIPTNLVQQKGVVGFIALIEAGDLFR